MGAVNSKKKEVKAYASKYSNSLMQYSSSTTSSQQQQQTSSTSHKKVTETNDSLKTKTSIYSTDSATTPTSNTTTNSNKNTGLNQKSVAPPLPSSTNTTTTTSTPNSTSEPRPFFSETNSLLQNAHQSNSFYLPKDWDLKEYQYNLHFALKSLFGGNVTPSVTPRLKKGARVVQMGTCSGPWIMDMATQYPECHFTAVEVIPNSLQALPSLPNISFQRDQLFTQGLDFPDESIDYVHLRSMGLSINAEKWPLLYAELRRILKPDGVVRLEEIHHAPAGTVMIESFIETLRQILADHNQDYDIAPKHGAILQENGFQVLESKKKTVVYGSDDKVSEDLVIVILNGFEDLGSVLAPRLGLDIEDYRHRVEMICAQCVKINAHMNWYSWVGKKASTTISN
ncbi:hypothetical protein INT47_003239 [Mucor saturninus]|uniref:Methyltransferase domain-containing protein n=1 Tax=Mucor saturninus TaxID=64648 RepID=A0A8H7RF30_9FUNG|nr:hypothetical protein INT47_003239 [Mucor saturninus]